jgi:hypothetical protein
MEQPREYPPPRQAHSRPLEKGPQFRFDEWITDPEMLDGIFPAGAVRNELGEEFRGRNQERCSDRLCKTTDHRATCMRGPLQTPLSRGAVVTEGTVPFEAYHRLFC